MPVNMQLRYGKNRKGMTSPNRGTTTISSVHVPITGQVHQRGQSSGGSDNDMNHSRNEVSYEKTKQPKKKAKSPYKNKLKKSSEIKKPDEIDPISSERSEYKFETYLEQQLLSKTQQSMNSSPDQRINDLSVKVDKLQQDLFSANRYIQNQLQAKNDQEKIILGLRQQLAKQIEEQTPKDQTPKASSDSNGRSKNSPKTNPLVRENEKLRSDMMIASQALTAKNEMISELETEKHIYEDRIATLQAEIEELWATQGQRKSTSYDSRRDRSPERELKVLQRAHLEQTEKLEITYEVNNILKLQLSKLMSQMKEKENEGRIQSPQRPSNSNETEIKNLNVIIQQLQSQLQQERNENQEREKMYLDQIRTMQNQSVYSQGSSTSEVNMERAKRKIESQKLQKEELKQLLKDAQDQLQETILQNQELRRQLSKKGKPAAKDEPRPRVISTQKTPLKGNKRISVTDHSPPPVVQENPETKEAKHMVGSMIKTMVTFKQKIKKIHEKTETTEQAKQDANLNDLLSLFAGGPSEPVVTEPVSKAKTSASSVTEQEPQIKISNVNLMRMLIELQQLIKEIDPNDYAKYQKDKISKDKISKSTSPQKQPQSAEQEFLEHFGKAYNVIVNQQTNQGVNQLDAMIPNLSTTQNSDSLVDLQTQTQLSQKQNEIDALKQDIGSMASLLSRYNEVQDFQKDRDLIGVQMKSIVAKN